MDGKVAAGLAATGLFVVCLCVIGARQQQLSQWKLKLGTGSLLTDVVRTKGKKCPLTNGNTTTFGGHLHDLRCSTSLFREYYTACGYFPTGGRWETVPYNGENITKFQPTACHFQWPNTEKLRLSLNLQKSIHLVLMGSSQMLRYSKGVIAVLQKVGYRCSLIQNEHQVDRTPDGSYFRRKNIRVSGKLQVRPHHCSGCVSSIHSCTTSWGSIDVEYIAMDDILDSTVRLYNRQSREKSIETYQEYVFRLFLKDRYPDVLVISPTLNHVKFKDSVGKFALDMDYLRGLMSLYLPRQTQIIWIPGMGESEKTRNSKQYLFKRVDGVLASTKIDQLNHILYAKTEHQLLNASSGISGFLDLYQASLDRGDWYKDGVHLQQVWYKTMAAYILELIYVTQ